MKKAIKLLETLPEPYRSEAFKDCISPNILVSTVANAVIRAIDWSTSSKGTAYYQTLYKNIDTIMSAKNKNTTYKIITNELYGHLQAKALKELIHQNITEVEVNSLQEAIDTINPNKALLPNYWKYWQGENNLNLKEYMARKEQILALPSEIKGRQLLTTAWDRARIQADYWNATLKQWESDQLFDMMDSDRDPDWAAYLLSKIGQFTERPSSVERSHMLKHYYDYQAILKAESIVDAVEARPKGKAAGIDNGGKGAKVEVSTQTEEKQELKLISEWLSTIYDEEVRTKAINNMKLFNRPDYKHSTMQFALAAAFPWAMSPEGFKYWNAMSHRLVKEAQITWKPLNEVPEIYRYGLAFIRRKGIVGLYKIFKFRAIQSEQGYSTAKLISKKGPIATFTYIPNTAIDADLEYAFIK